MNITHLHLLAQRELHNLARARYLPRGYDRQAARRAQLGLYELNKHLPAALATVTDRLMSAPDYARIQKLCHQAAQKPRLKDMVLELVRLLAAEPVMDQENANALAESAERSQAIERLNSDLRNVRKELDKHAPTLERLELDFDDVYASLNRLERELQRKARELAVAYNDLVQEGP